MKVKIKSEQELLKQNQQQGFLDEHFKPVHSILKDLDKHIKEISGKTFKVTEHYDINNKLIGYDYPLFEKDGKTYYGFLDISDVEEVISED